MGREKEIDTDDGERARISRVYAAYGRSRRKQSTWASDNPGNAAIRTELVNAACHMAAAELNGRGDILDVGCGTGWWLEALIGRQVESSRLHGIDLQSGRAQAARIRAPGATIEDGDARVLPFEDGQFDLVSMFLCASSLSGPRDVARAVGEAQRVTRPGKIVLVYEGRIGNPLNPATRLVRPASLQVAGLISEAARSLTVLPPLARRLGPITDRSYPRLAKLSLLNTHYLLRLRRV